MKPFRPTAKKIILILAAILFGLFFLGWWYLKQFSLAAKIPTVDVVRETVNGIKNPYSRRYLTFLVLGVDQRPDEPGLLTDTIIVAVINRENGDYLLFSLPRDLWIDNLKTKINALFYYGRERDPQDGTLLVKQEVEKIIDWPIDQTFVISMSQVKSLVDLLGGVKIEVENSFIDNNYPLDDGSHQVTTISFAAGQQQMDGEKILQYIRSRKSASPIEGTDDARQKRQKKAILAIKDKLMGNRRLWLQPEKVGSLYLFLVSNIESKPSLNLDTLASWWPFAVTLPQGTGKESEIAWKGDGAILKPGKDPVFGTWILVPDSGDWEKVSRYFRQQLP